MPVLLFVGEHQQHPSTTVELSAKGALVVKPPGVEHGPRGPLRVAFVSRHRLELQARLVREGYTSGLHVWGLEFVAPAPRARRILAALVRRTLLRVAQGPPAPPGDVPIELVAEPPPPRGPAPRPPRR